MGGQTEGHLIKGKAHNEGLLSIDFSNSLWFDVQVLTPMEKAKARGNKAFAAGSYEDAIDHFSEAISVDKGNYVLYSNR